MAATMTELRGEIHLTSPGGKTTICGEFSIAVPIRYEPGPDGATLRLDQDGLCRNLAVELRRLADEVEPKPDADEIEQA
jgi:hypothetical protein